MTLRGSLPAAARLALLPVTDASAGVARSPAGRIVLRRYRSRVGSRAHASVVSVDANGGDGQVFDSLAVFPDVDVALIDTASRG